jgi:alkanesulfonate monooxygenase SsuD/methylene tetrahydromethanopterin reductase-like flavin-dependent oxidoreductase (luciferase family)
MQMPALALAAVAGRRQKTIELAQEIERRGFAGIYCASFGDSLGLCLSIAHSTNTIQFGTTVVPIYYRTPFDMGQQAAYIHEIAGGRFRLGVGVSHEPANRRLGVETGRPLKDIRTTSPPCARHPGLRRAPRPSSSPPSG